MAAGGRQAALLRGINVGRAKRVAMADLRALVAELGYADVRTLLNSGNVVYTAPGVKPEKAAAAIEKALRERTGIASRVTVLTAKEVAEIVAANPLADQADNPSRLMVTVLTDPADRTRLDPLAKQDWGSERLAIGRRVAYQWVPDGVAESALIEAVGKALGDGATTRNWATFLKLQALFEGDL